MGWKVCARRSGYCDRSIRYIGACNGDARENRLRVLRRELADGAAELVVERRAGR
jgi:hypothetical protein